MQIKIKYVAFFFLIIITILFGKFVDRYQISGPEMLTEPQRCKKLKNFSTS